MFAELFVTLVVSVSAFVLLWALKRKNYWRDKGVTYIDSPILLGSFFKTLILREPVTETFDRLYNHPSAKNEPFIGVNLFHKPAILIRDPEMIKKVMVKDFNYFSDRYTSTPADIDPISGLNLFLVNNPLWKMLRNKLSPVFTSGKMKQMFYLLDQVGKVLHEQVAIKVKRSPIIEIRELMSGFTIDSISIAAFATDAKCLKEDETSEFKKIVSEALSATFLNKIGFKSAFLLPELFRLMKLTMFSPAFNEFIRMLFKDVMDDRAKSGVVRHDLIDTLLMLKRNDDKGAFTDDVLVAQSATFLVAGFETSSSTMAFLTYELAKHPEIMQKIRDELHEALQKTNGELTYDLITNGLPYMTACVYETLRLYPIVPFLDRVVSLPSGKKSYSLEPFSNVELPDQTPVFISAFSLHRDPQYFKNPTEFNPERFLGQRDFNEFAFLPFGNGPRVCIGE